MKIGYIGLGALGRHLAGSLLRAGFPLTVYDVDASCSVDLGKAGGVGLNLTAATEVIHLDPWWNPAVEDQASDRAHRIGQDRAVTIYRLVANGTIEEQILGLHADKRTMVASLLEGTASTRPLGADELLRLLGGDLPDPTA